MGSKLSRLSQSSTRSRVIHIAENPNPQPPRPSRDREDDDRDGEKDKVYPFKIQQEHSSSTLSSSSSCEVNHPTSPIDPQHHRLSIESLVSTDSSSSDDFELESIIAHHQQLQAKKCLVKPAPLTGGVVNLAALDPLKMRQRQKVETESERLFREEQERQDKEKQQERAKTARLKRR